VVAVGGPVEARRFRWRWALHLIGPAILVALFLRVDVAATFAALRRCDLRLVAAALVLLPPLLLLRNHRWVLLLHGQGVPVSFREALPVYAFSVVAGAVTPGRVGEFVKVFFVRGRSNSMGAALLSVFLDRLLDVLVLAVAGVAALAGFSGASTGPLLALSIALAGAAVGVVAVSAGAGSRDFLARLLEHVIPGATGAHAGRVYRDFGAALAALPPRWWVIPGAETLAAWLLNWLAIQLMAFALGLSITFVQVAAVSAVTALLVLLPISILGVGTRDAAMVVLLGRIGVSAPAALALSALTLLLLLAWTALCAPSLLTAAATFRSRRPVLDAASHDESTAEALPSESEAPHAGGQ
jgi:glycosyltransferase 2 family protein